MIKLYPDGDIQISSTENDKIRVYNTSNKSITIDQHLKTTYNTSGDVNVYNNRTFCSNLVLRDGSQFNTNSLSGIEEMLPALPCEHKIDTESMAEVITRSDNTIIVT